MTTVAEVRADLIAEQDALDELLSTITPEQWATPTASPRWTVADQIGHLAFFDDTAALAISNPEAFREHVASLAGAFGDELAVDEATLSDYRRLSPDELVATWREHRESLARAALSLTDDDRVIWYGPSMGSKSFLTARLMECWAHGQDAADAVAADRSPSDRIQHIVRLGVITRAWAYINRSLEVPDTDVLVDLEAPSGARWTFGGEDAAESITGPAEDFCLVVTQRRHVDDTGLVVRGASAREWMGIAQAFAGPPTNGPAPIEG